MLLLVKIQMDFLYIGLSSFNFETMLRYCVCVLCGQLYEKKRNDSKKGWLNQRDGVLCVLLHYYY